MLYGTEWCRQTRLPVWNSCLCLCLSLSPVFVEEKTMNTLLKTIEPLFFSNKTPSILRGKKATKRGTFCKSGNRRNPEHHFPSEGDACRQEIHAKKSKGKLTGGERERGLDDLYCSRRKKNKHTQALSTTIHYFQATPFELSSFPISLQRPYARPIHKYQVSGRLTHPNSPSRD